MTGLLVSLLLTLSPAAPSQETAQALPFPLEAERREPPQNEGPLQNDVFLPVAEEAQVLLGRGDNSLRRAREKAARGATDDARRSLIAALDDWFAALGSGSDESSVRPQIATEVGLADGGPRGVTEGLSYALLRRLGGLEASERVVWRERFGPAAQADLEGTATNVAAQRFAGIERKYPATRAAAQAALWLTDQAIEAGRNLAAGVWLERAEAHAELAEEPDLTAAAQRRSTYLSSSSTAETPAWTEAAGLVFLGSLELEDDEQDLPDRRGRRPQQGVRPGLAWLAKDRFAVQSAGRVHLVSMEAEGPRRTGGFNPRQLAFDLGPWETPHTGRETPGWGMLPSASGSSLGSEPTEHLVVVAGRAFVPPGAEEEVEPNALLCVSLASGAPSLAWAIAGDMRLSGDGERSVDPRLRTTGGVELQPAPLIVGSLVLVQAREIADQERAWLYAFDLGSGELVWRRFLAQGDDLARSGGRFGGPAGARLASPVPLVSGGRVFAATHLGASLLLDLADGRPVWGLATRRRLATEEGWCASGPFLIQAEVEHALWDPADSDVLYRLRLAPLDSQGGPFLERASLFAGPPQKQGSAELLLGGTETDVMVVARRGPTQAVTLWRGSGSDPLDGLHLGPRERFRGLGLAQGGRVLASTEHGVYLFDRDRELYLLDYAALSPTDELGGGDLYAHGEFVVVLGTARLWAFRVR